MARVSLNTALAAMRGLETAARESWRRIGCDETYDRTACDSRRQAGTRLLLAALAFLMSLTHIPLPAMLLWACAVLTGEVLSWIGTEPRRQGRNLALLRTLRLTATMFAAFGWVSLGLLWWFSPGSHSKAVAIALIAGVLVHVVRGCQRSMFQLAVTALVPTLALCLLPLTGTSPVERAGMFVTFLMLVSYALSSGMRAVRSHAALEAAASELLGRQQAAEAGSRAKSEFLANMSHEIRTPLNSVVAMAHVLDDTVLSPRDREALRLIRSSGETLQRLMSDILDAAGIAEGRLEIESRCFHLGDLAREVAGRFEAEARARGMEFLVEIDPAADIRVRGDAGRVGQILANLLSNAVKFTDEGHVALALARVGQGGFRFTVSDTGIGFDQRTRARLFESFHQVDGSVTRRCGGAGLGLALSRRLAELMNGTVDCESQPGRGSEFWLELPLTPPEDASAGCPDPAATHSSGLSILVADDHPANLKVVEIILAGAGIAPVCVMNGREAVQAAEARAFDLVFMDIQMPVMDGLEAVATIRADERRSGRAPVPIVMLTANTARADVEAGRAAGANAHLAKPVTPERLFQAVAEHGHAVPDAPGAHIALAS